MASMGTPNIWARGRPGSVDFRAKPGAEHLQHLNQGPPQRSFEATCGPRRRRPAKGGKTCCRSGPATAALPSECRCGAGSGARRSVLPTALSGWPRRTGAARAPGFSQTAAARGRYTFRCWSCPAPGGSPAPPPGLIPRRSSFPSGRPRCPSAGRPPPRRSLLSQRRAAPRCWG